MEGRLCRPARTGNCAVTRIFAQNLSHAAQNRNNGGSAGGCGCAMFRRGRPCTRKVIRYAYANRRHARRRGRAGAHTQASILEYKFFPDPRPPPPRLTHKIATNRRHTNSNTLPRAHGVCAPIHEQPDAIYFVRVGVVDLLSTSTGDGRGMDLGTGIFGRAVFLMSVRAARQHLLVCAAASICCEPGMGVGMWLMFLLLIPSLF